jgi:hypothetical protein
MATSRRQLSRDEVYDLAYVRVVCARACVCGLNRVSAQGVKAMSSVRACKTLVVGAGGIGEHCCASFHLF